MHTAFPFITLCFLSFLIVRLNFSSDAAVLEPASGLGADLLDLYQRGEQCDITIQVAEQVFSCHRLELFTVALTPLHRNIWNTKAQSLKKCHQAWSERVYFTTSQSHLPDVTHYSWRSHICSRGWSFSDAGVVVAAGNHGDWFLPACAQGSSQPANASQREEAGLFFGCSAAVICMTVLAAAVPYQRLSLSSPPYTPITEKMAFNIDFTKQEIYLLHHGE